MIFDDVVELLFAESELQMKRQQSPVQLVKTNAEQEEQAEWNKRIYIL